MLGGFFDLVKYMIAEWGTAFQNIAVIIDEMTLYHLCLASAFQVPEDNIKTEEVEYIEMIKLLHTNQALFNGSTFNINTVNRL